MQGGWDVAGFERSTVIGALLVVLVSFWFARRLTLRLPASAPFWLKETVAVLLSLAAGAVTLPLIALALWHFIYRYSGQ